ncbi:MAG TPA: hypothetical protein DCX91_15720 [Stenotrophomonas sp.]|nr:hypothetical protein [Stenotrophomonas sp.]
MAKCSLLLSRRVASMVRPPSDSMVALALCTEPARPTACPCASSAPPMLSALSPPPALKMSACSRLTTVPAPMSRRSRAAMVAARVTPSSVSSLLTRVVAPIDRRSP